MKDPNARHRNIRGLICGIICLIGSGGAWLLLMAADLSTNIPGASLKQSAAFRTLDIPSISVAAASGNTDWVDTAGMRECAAFARLVTLTGGTAPTVQMILDSSPDASNWATVGNVGTVMNAAADTRGDFTRRTLLRYARFSWATTGAPATATVDLDIQCR